MLTFAQELIGNYDKVQSMFSSLVSEIMETLEGDSRKTALQAAFTALNSNHSADTQMTALVEVRLSIRRKQQS